MAGPDLSCKYGKAWKRVHPLPCFYIKQFILEPASSPYRTTCSKARKDDHRYAWQQGACPLPRAKYRWEVWRIYRTLRQGLLKKQESQASRPGNQQRYLR